MHSPNYLAELFKIGLDVLQACCGRETANKYLLGPHHLHSFTNETKSQTDYVLVIICNLRNIPRLSDNLWRKVYQLGVGLPGHCHLWLNQLPIKLVCWVVQYLDTTFIS